MHFHTFIQENKIFGSCTNTFPARESADIFCLFPPIDLSVEFEMKSDLRCFRKPGDIKGDTHVYADCGSGIFGRRKQFPKGKHLFGFMLDRLVFFLCWLVRQLYCLKIIFHPFFFRKYYIPARIDPNIKSNFIQSNKLKNNFRRSSRLYHLAPTLHLVILLLKLSILFINYYVSTGSSTR